MNGNINQQDLVLKLNNGRVRVFFRLYCPKTDDWATMPIEINQRGVTHSGRVLGTIEQWQEWLTVAFPGWKVAGQCEAPTPLNDYCELERRSF